MYTSLLGAAAFMNWKGGLKTERGIWWFAVGGILGWPFAAALCFPFLAEEAIFALISTREQFLETVLRVSRGVLSALFLQVRCHYELLSIPTMLTSHRSSILGSTLSSTKS